MFQVIPLLVGFTGGQVHLIDPVHKVGLHLQGDQQVFYFIRFAELARKKPNATLPPIKKTLEHTKQTKF